MSLADYKLNPDFADADELQRYFSDIARRLVRAENQEALIQAATRDLIEFGLQRVDENLAPAIDRLQQASELGFLVAESATSLTLATGEVVFEIAEGPQRDLFKPTPVLTITREAEGAENQYAVARLTSYDPVTGGLVVDVQAISGISGAHDDWVIAASTGLAPAIIAFASIVADDKATVAADKAATLGYRNTAQTAASDANTAKATAQDWASKAENSVVTGGLYSALHYAAKAAASAAAAQTWDPSSYYTKAQTYSQAEVTAAIGAAIDAMLAGAPGALDTLYELAAALGNDANFATTVTNALAGKAAASHTHGYADLVSAAIASQSEVRSNTASKLLAVQPALASLDWVNLTDAATIAFDMSAGVNRKLTLGGNRILGQITNAIPGMTFAIEVSQPGSGSTHTLSYHSSYVTPASGITIKTGNNIKTLLVGVILGVSGGLATKTFIAMAGDGWTA